MTDRPRPAPRAHRRDVAATLRALPFSRTLSLCIPLALSSAAAAQSPLETTFLHDNGGAPGGSVYFDLTVTHPAGVTITSLDVNTTTADGALDVYVAAGVGYDAIAATPSAWTLAASGPFVGAGGGNATSVCLTPALQLPPGTYAVALHGPGVAHAYTTGGPSVPQTYATNELSLTAGAASILPFGGAQYAPRVFNGRLHYEQGLVPGLLCASRAPVGGGCVDGAVSFFEVFDSLAALDLAGTTAAPFEVRATAAGALGYVVTTGVGAWQQPLGGKLLTNTSPAIDIGDDHVSEAAALPFAFPFAGGSASVVHATSNGYLLLGPTTATAADLLPTTGELLAEGPRLCPLWADLHASANATTNPQAGVYYDIVAGGQEVVFTWLDVADGRAGTPAAGATSVNVQCALFANGDFVFRYAELTVGGGFGQGIVGWSPGGDGGVAARDPGPTDLTAAGGYVTSGPDSHPLVHTTGLARLGDAIALAVADAEDLLPFAVVFAGAPLPSRGVDLTPLGAPGCGAFVSLDATAVLPLQFPGGEGSMALAVPDVPALSGATFASQCLALSAKNAFGFVTSNAMVWTIGR